MMHTASKCNLTSSGGYAQGDTLPQLEAARSAIVQLHTQLSKCQKQQQAAAAEHHEVFTQLEHKQHLLDQRLESMSATLDSFHEQHHNAVCDLRTHVKTFLTELILVVGRQFDSMQAELKNSQAETIQAEVEKALAGAYSAAAGKKMERWVHSKITDLTHHIQQGDVRMLQELPAKARTPLSEDTENKENQGTARARHGRARSDAAVVHQHQKQVACQTKPDGLVSMDQATQTMLARATASRPDEKKTVARSQDSLSLMGHASAAGSRTPTLAKSPVVGHPLPKPSVALREPLAKLDMNQTGHQYQGQGQGQQQHISPGASLSADLSEAESDPIVRSSNEQQPQHHQRQSMQDPDVDTQEADLASVHWLSAAAVAAAAGSSTVRQLDQELLSLQQQDSSRHEDSTQGYQQSAIPLHQLPDGADGMLNATSMPRHVDDVNGVAGLLLEAESLHAEELQILAAMLASTATPATQTQMAMELSAAASDNQAASAATVLAPAMGASQQAKPQQRLGTLYKAADHPLASSQHTPNSSCALSERQAQSAQYAVSMQRPDVIVQDVIVLNNAGRHYAPASVPFLQQQQQQPQQQQPEWDMGAELPAGIPLTPVPIKQALPRDSLEASIWKLSSSQRKQQLPISRPVNVVGLQQNQQQSIPGGRSLRMVRDSLEATLRSLAARQ